MQGIKENKIKMKWLCLSQDDIDRRNRVTDRISFTGRGYDCGCGCGCGFEDNASAPPYGVISLLKLERDRGQSVGAQFTGLHASSNHEGDKCDSEQTWRGPQTKAGTWNPT